MKRNTIGVCAAALRVLMAVSISAQVFVVPSAAQEPGSTAQGPGSVDVVLPAGVSADSADLRKLISSVQNNLAIPGIPSGLLHDRRITVRFEDEGSNERDASSYPTTGTVILPIEYWDWDLDRRVRTVRHELAHIALATFFEFAPLPHWFEEGFAEWAAGGLTCKGEARIRLDLLVRRRGGLMPPRLEMLDSFATSRLGYDYYGTFFAYTDARAPGSLESGRLLSEIRAHGFGQGFLRVAGENLATLEAAWREDLQLKYGTIPSGFSCP